MRRKTILVVDDDIGITETMRDVLEDAGHDVDTSSNGMEAVKRVGVKNYDLVLMDIKMPVMNGIEAYRRIKGRCKANIVFVTANVNIDDAAEIASEHREVLLKPINMKRLTDIIATIA